MAFVDVQHRKRFFTLYSAHLRSYWLTQLPARNRGQYHACYNSAGENMQAYSKHTCCLQPLGLRYDDQVWEIPSEIQHADARSTHTIHTNTVCGNQRITLGGYKTRKEQEAEGSYITPPSDNVSKQCCLTRLASLTPMVMRHSRDRRWAFIAIITLANPWPYF